VKVIDSHAHLNLPEFKKDLNEVVLRAKSAGVVHCVVVGINPSTNEKAIKLFETMPEFVSPAVGFHPHEVASLKEEDYQTLKAQLKLAVALGEIGLDWVKEYSPRDIQVVHFERQLEIAKEFNKPVILHLRGDSKLWETAFSILENFLPLNFVAHCFTEGTDIAKKILDLGGFISIPGIVTFKNADKLREAVRFIPEDCLLVETDCPFLAPVPMRGKRNEPAFVIYTLKKVAEVKGTSDEELADTIFKNTLNFFKGIKVV